MMFSNSKQSTSKGDCVNPGLFCWHGQSKPLIQSFTLPRRKTVGLIDQHQGITRDMGQGKAIVIAASLSFDAYLGIQAWRRPDAHEELIIPATLTQNEFLEILTPRHPAQHLEEADEVGFSGTIGANQHCQLRQLQILDLGEAAKTADGQLAMRPTPHAEWRSQISDP